MLWMSVLDGSVCYDGENNMTEWTVDALSAHLSHLQATQNVTHTEKPGFIAILKPEVQTLKVFIKVLY